MTLSNPAMTTNWSLFYKYDGDKPVVFFEARRFDSSVWSATGMSNTWGNETLNELASPDAAQVAYAGLCADAAADGFTLARQADVDLDQLDVDLLAGEIRDGARLSFKAIRAAHPDQTINAFGLLSDESAMTIVSVANSKEALAKADDDDVTRWSPTEWSFFEADEYLDIAYRMILPYHRDIPNNTEVDALRAWVFEACASALSQLAQEGCFGSVEERDEMALVFQVSDGDGDDDVVERLNTAKSVERYAAWRVTWDRGYTAQPSISQG